MPILYKTTPSIVETLISDNDISIEKIKLLILDKADVNEIQDETNLTPLDVAAEISIEMVKFLVEQGATVQGIQMPSVKNVEIFDFLLEKGATTGKYLPKIKDLDVAKRLFIPSEGSSIWELPHCNYPLETLKYFVEEIGFNPKGTFQTAKSLDIVKYLLSKGVSALPRKVTKNHLKSLEVTKFLIEELKFNFKATNNWGETLLHKTTVPEVAEYLISKGLDVNVSAGEGGWTPLHSATFSKAPLEYLKFLKKAGANVNAVDKKGQLPFHLCNTLEAIVWYINNFNFDPKIADTNGDTLMFKTKSFRVADYLINVHDIKPTIRDVEEACKHQLVYKVTRFAHQGVIENGYKQNRVYSDIGTSLHVAENPKILEILFRSRPNLDVRDDEGRTALHCAVKNHNVEKVDKLLEYGIDINAVDNKGRTAFHYACRSGFAETAKKLLNMGVNFKIQDVKGEPALHYAVNAEIAIAIVKKMSIRW